MSIIPDYIMHVVFIGFISWYSFVLYYCSFPEFVLSLSKFFSFIW